MTFDYSKIADQNVGFQLYSEDPTQPYRLKTLTLGDVIERSAQGIGKISDTIVELERVFELSAQAHQTIAERREQIPDLAGFANEALYRNAILTARSLLIETYLQ